jgi:hypothetical protein
MSRRNATVTPIRPTDDKPGDTEFEANGINAWLQSVRPLSGICHCEDERFHAGRAQVGRIAATYSRDAEPPNLNAEEAANLLHFLSNTEPGEWHATDDASVGLQRLGHCVLLEVAEATLRRLAGLAGALDAIKEPS